MATQDSDDNTLSNSTWRASAPHVRKALTFIKRKGTITAEDLVLWDRDHGRKLFEWDDPAAAEDWRRHQARLFLNSFRAVFEGMRVRGYIHVRENEETGVEASGYVDVETIAQHPGMRSQVIDDIMRRMRMLASELRMWKLTKKEQEALFARLADAMTDQKNEAA